MKCPLKDCKFNHGKPLSDQFRGILLKHLETAPKEIIGDFPRIGREKALKLMDAQHLKLLAKERGDKEPESLSNTPNIPSLLDSIMPKRNNNTENRARRTRWCDLAVPPAPTLPSVEKKPSIPEYMSIKNMTGILTPQQIEDLLEMGIESVEQIRQLTLAQMDKFGLTITQITDIQSNVQNIEKVMKDKKEDESTRKSPERTKSTSPATTVINQDLDLRIPPTSQVPAADKVPPVQETQDIDMRFLPTTASNLVGSLSNVPITGSSALHALDQANDSEEEPPIDPQKLLSFRNMFGGGGSTSLVDFSQYLKDAHMKENEETDEAPVKNENHARQTDETNFNEDEESELQIDESCYSEDEEAKEKVNISHETKEEETKSDDAIMSPVHTQESIIATLKELEKMKQKEQEEKQIEKAHQSSSSSITAYSPAVDSLSTFSSFYEAPPQMEKPTEHPKPTSDPRTRRISNEIKSPSLSDSADESFVKRPSIYDQYSDNENDDYGNIAKKTDKDMRLAHIDTDLSTGDMDLRLPFKPILASLIPASEINGSINSHPPMTYKVSLVLR